MRKVVILLLVLSVQSCTSYQRYDKNYGALKAYYKAIDNYPDQAKFEKSFLAFQEAKASGDPTLIKQASKVAENEGNQLVEYLSAQIDAVSIPFTQAENTEKYRVKSVKTGKVLPYNSNNQRPNVELIITYEPLVKIRKYDYMHIECYDQNNFCYSSINPLISSDGISIEPISLVADHGTLDHFIIY